MKRYPKHHHPIDPKFLETAPSKAPPSHTPSRTLSLQPEPTPLHSTSRPRHTETTIELRRQHTRRTGKSGRDTDGKGKYGKKRSISQVPTSQFGSIRPCLALQKGKKPDGADENKRQRSSATERSSSDGDGRGRWRRGRGRGRGRVVLLPERWERGRGLGGRD